MQQENIPLLSIICTSYNHEKYIRECLDGFLMQKTDFLYEIIVHDDASTDNTAKIIREYDAKYPKLFNNIYQSENQFSKADVNIWFDIVFPIAKGKYIAICEGDDFWIDPLKLQKQVDFIQNNPEYGLVHSGFRILNQNTGMLNFNRKNLKKNDNIFNSLLNGNYVIATLTVCFKKDFCENYLKDIDPHTKKWLMGDLPFWLYISKFSKIHYLDEVTSTYRVLSESASNTNNIERMIRFEENVRDLKLFFLQKYNPENSKLKNQIQSFFLYRKIVANISLNGSFKDFLMIVIKFHKINRSLRLFFGSFLQFVKKLRKSF